MQIIPSILLLLRDYCNTHPTPTAASTTNGTATTNSTTMNSKSNGSKLREDEDSVIAVKKYAALTAQRVLKVPYIICVYCAHFLPTHTQSYCYLSVYVRLYKRSFTISVLTTLPHPPPPPLSPRHPRLPVKGVGYHGLMRSAAG